MHHSMCDKGKIPYQEVKNIIIEQTQKEAIPHYSQYFQVKRLNTDGPNKFTPNIINVSFLEGVLPINKLYIKK